MYIYSAGRISSLMINNTSQSDSCVFHLTFFTHIKLRQRTSLYFSLIPTIKTLFSETDVSPVQKNPDWFFKPHIFLPRFVWTSRGGSRIFLGGGALVSCSTSTPINYIVFFFCRIPVVWKTAGHLGGGGVRTPCTLPLDPPLIRPLMPFRVNGRL